MKPTTIMILVILLQVQAMAWGERGHHTVGQVAALLVSDLATSQEDKKSIGDFYKTRALAFGHLNNIPDISWKSQTNKTITKLNGPTHYVDLDIFFEIPSLTALRSMPKKYSDLFDKYSEAQITKAGSAPWRIQELFERANDIGRCLKKLENNPAKAFRKHVISPSGNDIIIGKTKCDEDIESVALAYTSVLGVMGHFVADLGQPYHTTKDFDGWQTAQGGIHGYFETDIVQELPDDLLLKVNLAAQKKIKTIMKTDSSFDLAMSLAFESFSLINKVKDLDRSIALIEKSQGKVHALRLAPDDPKILKAFEPLIVELMANSAAHLAVLFHQSWQASGQPRLSQRSKIAAPYPLDVGFIKPSYLK